MTIFLKQFPREFISFCKLWSEIDVKPGQPGHALGHGLLVMTIACPQVLSQILIRIDT